MEKFKKWWSGLLCSNNKDFLVIAELSWKKALEKVLTQAIMADDTEDVVEWIKKELDNE